MTGTALNDDDRRLLLKIARETIESNARTGQVPALPEPLPESLKAGGGAFVTLHRRGKLRGCIGSFVGEGPLAATVQKMARAAGWEDSRFPELAVSELADLDIEISVLSPLAEVSGPEAVQAGRHGLYITKGYHRGVLLPQVAVEQGWDRDQFLSHTCLKAGLPADEWRQGKLKLEVFTAEVFGEKEFKDK